MRPHIKEAGSAASRLPPFKEGRKLAEQTTEEKVKTLKKKLTLIAVSLKNATNQLDNGKVIGAATIDDLITQQEDLRKEIRRLESGEEKPSKVKESELSEPISNEDILEGFKIKRKAYTMSPEAFEQRRKNAKKASEKMQESGAATGPTTKEGKKASSRNSWKTGLYANSFISSYNKPCTSTCKEFPCSLIEDNKTAPGQDCLDKQHVYEAYNAIMQGLLNDDYEGINALVGFETATNFEVMRRLKESLFEDGVVVMHDKLDKDGNVIGHELKLHPAMQVIPKFNEILGFTLKDLMLTPKALINTDLDKKKEKSVLDLMTEASKNLKSIKENTE